MDRGPNKIMMLRLDLRIGEGRRGGRGWSREALMDPMGERMHTAQKKLLNVNQLSVLDDNGETLSDIRAMWRGLFLTVESQGRGCLEHRGKKSQSCPRTQIPIGLTECAHVSTFLCSLASALLVLVLMLCAHPAGENKTATFCQKGLGSPFHAPLLMRSFLDHVYMYLDDESNSDKNYASVQCRWVFSIEVFLCIPDAKSMHWEKEGNTVERN